MAQAETDARRFVPDKPIQTVLYRVVAVLIRHDCQGILNLLFAGQPIVFLKIKEQVFNIRIRKCAGVPAPSHIPYNIDPLCQ